jgi:DNA-directed RNA polymerase sigma subunit (sigma70/sigma32)
MKKTKNLELQGEIGPELKALLEEISPEELETGILKTNRKTKAKNWTAAEIQNTVQTELTVRSVGKLLSLARAERGQTLAEVSQNLSVSRGRVHQREQEDANLEVRSLVEQAGALGFDVVVTLKPRKAGRNIRAELR